MAHFYAASSSASFQRGALPTLSLAISGLAFKGIPLAFNLLKVEQIFVQAAPRRLHPSVHLHHAPSGRQNAAAELCQHGALLNIWQPSATYIRALAYSLI